MNISSLISLLMTIKYTKEQFIRKAKLAHPNKNYNYSKVNYVNTQTKVTIICPVHGDFEQMAGSHLQGIGCRKCGHIKAHVNSHYTTDDFIKLSRQIHGIKYDYSKVKYINSQTKVLLICSIPGHGQFWQKPNNHIGLKHGCYKCRNIKIGEQSRYTKEQFIEKAKKIHGDRYDNSLVKYERNDKSVIIICKKHGQFKQAPIAHAGTHKQGCPKCQMSKGEQSLMNYFKSKGIKFRMQKIFPGCKDKRYLKFDFYIKKWNLCIEWNGKQHYEEVDHFGGAEALANNIRRDSIKKDYCEENGIGIIWIRYDEPNPIAYLERKIIEHRVKSLEQRIQSLEDKKQII